MGTGNLAGEMERSIELYRLGFRISLIVAIVGCILMILFFLRFDIKTVFLIKTGRAKAKTVHKMQEANQKTGKLRDSTPVESALNNAANANANEKKHSGKTGAFAYAHDQVPTSNMNYPEKTNEPVHQTTVLNMVNSTDFLITKNISIIHTDELII